MKKLLIFSLILIFTLNAYSQNIKILYPMNTSNSNSKRVHIIFTSDSNYGLRLLLNNNEVKLTAPVKFKNKDKDAYIYHSYITLDVGDNKLSIIGMNEKKIINIIYNKATYDMSIKKDKNMLFHQSDDRFFCVSCHNFDNMKDCQLCHKSKLSGAFVHGPVASLSCNQCHDRNNYFSVFQPISKKCLDCHDDFSKKIYNYKYVHGPIGAGICNVCHSPHFANNKFFLKGEVNELCEYCHSDKKTGVHVLANFNKKAHPTSGKYILYYKEKLTCISCHNPHFGQSKQIFRDGIKDFLTLCIKCHKDKL